MRKKFSILALSFAAIPAAAQNSDEDVRFTYAPDYMVAEQCKHAGEAEEIYLEGSKEGYPQFLLCIGRHIMELPPRSACKIIGRNIERNENDAAVMTENAEARERYERLAMEWKKASRYHCPQQVSAVPSQPLALAL